MMRAIVIAAVTLTGLSAGLFATFSYAVMPGLRRTDDQPFVEAMRGINVAILNPVFGVIFVGAAVASVAALIAAWGTDARPWLIAAIGLYVVGAFVVTGAVNVPLNDALAEGTGNAAHLRAAFEDRWIAWNQVRSVLTTLAFGCLAVGATRL